MRENDALQRNASSYRSGAWPRPAATAIRSRPCPIGRMPAARCHTPPEMTTRAGPGGLRHRSGPRCMNRCRQADPVGVDGRAHGDTRITEENTNRPRRRTDEEPAALELHLRDVVRQDQVPEPRTMPSGDTGTEGRPQADQFHTAKGFLLSHLGSRIGGQIAREGIMSPCQLPCNSVASKSAMPSHRAVFGHAPEPARCRHTKQQRSPAPGVSSAARPVPATSGIPRSGR